MGDVVRTQAVLTFRAGEFLDNPTPRAAYWGTICAVVVALGVLPYLLAIFPMHHNSVWKKALAKHPSTPIISLIIPWLHDRQQPDDSRRDNTEIPCF